MLQRNGFELYHSCVFQRSIDGLCSMNKSMRFERSVYDIEKATRSSLCAVDKDHVYFSAQSAQWEWWNCDDAEEPNRTLGIQTVPPAKQKSYGEERDTVILASNGCQTWRDEGWSWTYENQGTDYPQVTRFVKLTCFDSDTPSACAGRHRLSPSLDTSNRLEDILGESCWSHCQFFSTFNRASATQNTSIQVSIVVTMVNNS